VISQTPSAGTSAQQTSTVTITIALRASPSG
jgi:beta-lactam-binding protein with PASTA domain